MVDDSEGCVQPARGPLVEGDAPDAVAATPQGKEPPMSLARVGAEAPDFEATAYKNGGFGTVRLSELRGKWIVLCFYPGDFTFV